MNQVQGRFLLVWEELSNNYRKEKGRDMWILAPSLCQTLCLLLLRPGFHSIVTIAPWGWQISPISQIRKGSLCNLSKCSWLVQESSLRLCASKACAFSLNYIVCFPCPRSAAVTSDELPVPGSVQAKGKCPSLRDAVTRSCIERLDQMSLKVFTLSQI